MFTVALRLGGSLLTYGLPVAGAFAVMHSFVPPHPGPAAAELVGADIDLVPASGLLIGLPTWFVGGYLFGLWAGRRYQVAVPNILGSEDDTLADRRGTSSGRRPRPWKARHRLSPMPAGIPGRRHGRPDRPRSARSSGSCSCPCC